MEVVWEPEEETLLLRSSDLVRDLTSTGTQLWISATEAAYWPYEAPVNIRGEVMRYKGKEYAYYKKTSLVEYVVVNSQDEKEKYDKISPSTKRSLNKFTGKLMVSERGIFGTDASTHVVAPYTSYS